MKRRLDPDEFERLARGLFHLEPWDHTDESSDSVFLAGFREKLRHHKAMQAVTFTVGQLGWRASPLLAPVCILLLVILRTFIAATPQVAPQVGASEELVQTVTTQEEAQLTNNEVLQAILTLNDGR
ncbi:MAG: hypothetical protein P8020_18575 [Acidobacteriota bacterium]